MGRIRPFVRAATELRCFGRVWCLAGAALLCATALLAASGAYDGAAIAATVVVVGLSTACVLGGLLLANRTGPEILYWRIFDRAPVLDREIPLEQRGETWRRMLAPALVLPAALAVAGPLLIGAALLMAGRPQDDVLDGFAALAPPAAGGWTLVAGVACLRMAAYFERWERRHGMSVVCQPMRAGRMRHVYRVVPGNPRSGAGAGR